MSDSLPSKEARWVSVRECFAVCTDFRQACSNLFPFAPPGGEKENVWKLRQYRQPDWASKAVRYLMSCNFCYWEITLLVHSEGLFHRDIQSVTFPSYLEYPN